MAQARAADDLKRQGLPIGPLHGVPVSVNVPDLRVEDDAHVVAQSRRLRREGRDEGLDVGIEEIVAGDVLVEARDGDAAVRLVQRGDEPRHRLS